MSKITHERYHALDSLRAVMMFLGIVIHGAISYITVPPTNGTWPFRDAPPSPVFDLLLFLIHAFRMPVFFVIGGFFSAFLYLERGESSFLRNRLARVAIPLVLFQPILMLLLSSGFWYAQGQTGQRKFAAYQDTLGVLYERSTWMHMWFMYYLLLFYAAVVLLARIPVPDSLTGLHNRIFRAALQSPFRAVGLAFVSILTILPMQSGALDTSASYIPQLRVFLAYGVYFTFGWLLYRSRDLLPVLKNGAWPQLIVALLIFPVNLMLVVRVGKTLPAYDPATHAAAAITTGILIALFVTSLLGLFLRYANTYSPMVRYCTDASYWVYLSHLPFTIWIPGLLVGVPIPTFAKFLIVEVVTLAATLITYHYFVRSTWLGQLLNGKRYSKALPGATPDMTKVAAATGD